MTFKTGIIGRICDAPPVIALLPAVAVIIDYVLTLSLSSGPAMILQWEASPLVRFAVAHNLMALYLPAIIIFYYCAAYAVLHILHSTPYYRYGILLVVLVSLTHVLGGLSWQFKNSWYSNTVIMISVLSVVISIGLFGYCIIRQKCATA